MQIKELGHIVFYVSNLKKSADFYKDVLGFREVHRDSHTALYSTGRTHHEMLLIEIGEDKGGENVKLIKPGLYHVGFKIGDSDDELKQAIQELDSNGVQIIGSANHHVTHSIYIQDPDGNEIELYIDTDVNWVDNPLEIMRPAVRLTL